MIEGYVSPVQPEDSMTFEKAKALSDEIREQLMHSADAAAISAKLSERKTVHEWLNNSGVPEREDGRPLCLLRRLRIAIDKLDERKEALESCYSIFTGPRNGDFRGYEGLCEKAINF